MSESSRGYRGRGLFSLLAAVLLVNFVLPDFLAAPLKLFVTFLHEAGHGLAAVFTGGSVHGIVLEPNGTGYAITSGGIRWVVIAGGYLGATFFGALFLRLNSLPKIRVYILECTALAVFLLTLFTWNSAFTLGYGLAASLVLAIVGLKTNDDIEFHVVTFLGVLVGMGALSDLDALIRIQAGAERVMASGMGHSMTDAEAMASLTGVPAMVWAVGWAVVAAVILLYEARNTATTR